MQFEGKLGRLNEDSTNFQVTTNRASDNIGYCNFMAKPMDVPVAEAFEPSATMGNNEAEAFESPTAMNNNTAEAEGTIDSPSQW